MCYTLKNYYKENYKKKLDAKIVISDDISMKALKFGLVENPSHLKWMQSYYIVEVDQESLKLLRNLPIDEFTEKTSQFYNF